MFERLVDALCGEHGIEIVPRKRSKLIAGLLRIEATDDTAVPRAVFDKLTSSSAVDNVFGVDEEVLAAIARGQALQV